MFRGIITRKLQGGGGIRCPPHRNRVNTRDFFGNLFHTQIFIALRFSPSCSSSLSVSLTIYTHASHEYLLLSKYFTLVLSLYLYISLFLFISLTIYTHELINRSHSHSLLLSPSLKNNTQDCLLLSKYLALALSFLSIYPFPSQYSYVAFKISYVLSLYLSLSFILYLE